MFMLIFVLLLVGCGSGRDYGDHYDVKDDITGLRIRLDARTHNVDTNEIIKWYISMMNCTEIIAPGPLLIFLQNKEDLPIGHGGYIFYPETIIVWSHEQNLHAGGISGYMAKHEFIHYLLNFSGFPKKANNSHNSLLFICEIN